MTQCPYNFCGNEVKMRDYMGISHQNTELNERLIEVVGKVRRAVEIGEQTKNLTEVMVILKTITNDGRLP